MSRHYPSTTVERAARREQYVGHAVRLGVEQAERLGRSIKCGELGRHSTDEDGCANDGSGCLCECHDPAEVTG